jgi:hypothetical protein
MAQVIDWLNCTFHKGDSTPSLAVYSDGHYFCYGCRASGSARKLGYDMDRAKVAPQIIEPLEASLAYIEGLPKKEIRGLKLPYDTSGYYIVWPGKVYYKKRYYTHGQVTEVGKGKYRCPSGHKKPPFFVAGRKLPHLVFVEGEINAMSLATVYPGSILCPGGANDFNALNFGSYAPILRLFDSCIIICDNDNAGIKAAIEAKAYVTTLRKPSTLILMDKDCNELLQGGKLDAWVKENLEM